LRFAFYAKKSAFMNYGTKCLAIWSNN